MLTIMKWSLNVQFLFQAMEWLLAHPEGEEGEDGDEDEEMGEGNCHWRFEVASYADLCAFTLHY